VIVFIVCDRGDRYLSTGVFPAWHLSKHILRQYGSHD
jgi:hypothetical protein